MPLSEKIQTLRKEHNLTQEALADQLNVSRQALSKWELGASTPEADKIIQLSEFFNVTTDYLLKDVDIIQNNKKSINNPRVIILLSTAFSLIGLIVGLAIGLDGASIFYISFTNVSIGLIFQVWAVLAFELLLSSLAKNEHTSTRSIFYGLNTWIITLIPIILFFGSFDKFIFFFIPIQDELFRYAFMFGLYILLNLVISIILFRVYKSTKTK